MRRLIAILAVVAGVMTWGAVQVSFGSTASPPPPPLPSPPPIKAPRAGSPLTATWPVPAAPVAQPVTIIIPRLGVHAPVYDRGVDAQGLPVIASGYAVTHYTSSAALGAAGNYVAYGHDDIQGQVFRSLALLRAGDAVELRNGSQRFTYTVKGSRVVPPTAVEVFRPTVEPTLTLISCTPYMVDTARIVVTAVLTRVS